MEWKTTAQFSSVHRYYLCEPVKSIGYTHRDRQTCSCKELINLFIFNNHDNVQGCGVGKKKMRIKGRGAGRKKKWRKNWGEEEEKIVDHQASVLVIRVISQHSAI